MASLQSVLLVDDHPVMRAGLAMMLDRAPEFALAAEASTAAEAREAIEKHKPDLVVLDLVLGGRDGVPVIGELLAKLVELAFDARQADDELLALADGFEDAAELVGDGERELEAISVECAAFRCDVEMNQADDGSLMPDRCADGTLG
jgi:CheY-like chemotaxis protein